MLKIKSIKVGYESILIPIVWLFVILLSIFVVKKNLGSIKGHWIYVDGLRLVLGIFICTLCVFYCKFRYSMHIGDVFPIAVKRNAHSWMILSLYSVFTVYSIYLIVSNEIDISFIELIQAPFIEELLFRGILLSILMQKLDIRSALIVSSIGFAFIHILDSPYMAIMNGYIGYLIMGIPRVISGSILIAIMGHFTANQLASHSIEYGIFLFLLVVILYRHRKESGIRLI